MENLYACLFLVTIGVLIISVLKLLETGESFWGGMMVSLIIAVITNIINVFFVIPNNYKQGQIDVLTNNIKYELKENPDKTREWIEIEKK